MNLTPLMNKPQTQAPVVALKNTEHWHLAKTITGSKPYTWQEPLGTWNAKIDSDETGIAVVGGTTESEAVDRAYRITRAVNSHAALVEALQKCENVIGMARLQCKLDDSGLSPVNDALVAARKALEVAHATKEVQS